MALRADAFDACEKVTMEGMSGPARAAARKAEESGTAHFSTTFFSPSNIIIHVFSDSFFAASSGTLS